MKRYYKSIGLFLIMGCFFYACKTIDLEKQNEILKENTSGEVEQSNRISEVIEVQKETIYIEKPIYIPSPEKPVETKVPITGIDSVIKSTGEGTITPAEYTYAARVYDYDSDQVYEIYCQTLRTTDIYLEAGEVVIDSPFISDSERWILGAGVHQQNGQVVQHIYVKPKTAGLEATLIINTSNRVYHLFLRSYNTVYMPMVKFKYQKNEIPQVYAQDKIASSINSEMNAVDPRFLSFDYKIKYNSILKPDWIPQKVYDDGKKTYIVFDTQVLQKELPGIFENSQDIVNYRVVENILIVDKLVEKITIKYNGKKITIEKKE